MPTCEAPASNQTTSSLTLRWVALAVTELPRSGERLTVVPAPIILPLGISPPLQEEGPAANPSKPRKAAVRRGFDAGKKIKGRKRHIVTDTEGHLVGLQVHAADIQDRDGAVGTLASIRRLYPWLRHIFADGGYSGDKLKEALAEMGQWTVEIIRRCDTAKGFVLLPRRWVVERTFPWLNRCRRLAKDFAASIESAVAWVFISHIRRLTRRLARA